MDCCDFNSLYYAVNAMCQKLNEVIKRVNEIDPGTSEIDGIRQQIERLETDVQSNSIALLEKYSPKNPPPYPVTSVNGKTGALVIDYQELVKNNGVQVKLMTATEYNGTTAQTWTAYYELGFRIVGVKSSTENKIEAFYLLKQDANDHTPIPVTVQGGGGEVDPNLIEQVQKNTEAISAINDEMPRKYSPTNEPPYPVTSVNNKKYNVYIDALFNSDGKNIIAADANTNAAILWYKGTVNNVLGGLRATEHTKFPILTLVNADGSEETNIILKNNAYFKENRIEYSGYPETHYNLTLNYGDCVLLSKPDSILPDGNYMQFFIMFDKPNLYYTQFLIRTNSPYLTASYAFFDPRPDGRPTIKIAAKSLGSSNNLTDAIILYNFGSSVTIDQVLQDPPH